MTRAGRMTHSAGVHMRFAKERALATLGAVALAASIVLLARLSQRAWRRKAVRDNAVSKLRESGEFFLAPVETEPRSAPIVGK
jgi:hypothetical protein